MLCMTEIRYSSVIITLATNVSNIINVLENPAAGSASGADSYGADTNKEGLAEY